MRLSDATGYVGRTAGRFWMKKQKAVWKNIEELRIKLLHTRSPVKQKMKIDTFRFLEQVALVADIDSLDEGDGLCGADDFT